jgi:hypothetical protein
MAYELNLRVYLSAMDRILDGKGELARAEATVARKREAAEENARKLARVKQLEAAVERMRSDIAAEEKAVSERCRLRQKYRREEPQDETADSAAGAERD